MSTMWRKSLIPSAALVCALVGVPSRGSWAQPSACFGAFRLVKVAPDAPSTPEITLPAGYGFVPGSQYQFATRAEYASFVEGPRNESIKVTVRWPGVPIDAVVSGKSRLELERDPEDPTRVTFALPVTATSAGAHQSTLQVASYISGSTANGIYWRMEHNDPDRVAGVWTGVPWPAAQVRTFPSLLVAAEAVLKDSGLAAEAKRRGHFFSLMGFETNNPLHSDNPPHWHLAYYPGLTFNAPRAHLPHFWMDAAGRTFYNGMDIQGQGRSKFYAGDPAPIHDAEGHLIVTLTIREDGGLNIDAPAGPAYSILPDGGFPQGVHVMRNGQPWRAVRSVDDVKAGLLETSIESLQSCEHQTTTYRYDRLTGAILEVTES